MSLRNLKLAGLTAIIFFPLIYLLFFVAPIEQSQKYHIFADRNTHIGILNFHNVISNLLFFLLPVMGFLDYLKNKSNYTPSWLLFLLGVFLVGPGSAYYHFTPNDQSLVWDRLPMTIGFMGLASFVFSEVFKIKKEILFQIALLVVGFYSIFHWVQFSDLRIYYWVQLTPLLAIIYVAFALPTLSLKSKHLCIAVLFYIFAKLTEKYDHQIFDSLGYSGHSIKHILAAVSVFSLIQMKKNK